MSSTMASVSVEIKQIKDVYNIFEDVKIKLEGRTVVVITESANAARIISKKTGYDVRIA